MRVQLRGFIFNLVFKKGNLEPTFWSALSLTQHRLLSPQATARQDSAIPQTLGAFLLQAFAQAPPQPARASPLNRTCCDSNPL